MSVRHPESPEDSAGDRVHGSAPESGSPASEDAGALHDRLDSILAGLDLNLPRLEQAMADLVAEINRERQDLAQLADGLPERTALEREVAIQEFLLTIGVGSHANLFLQDL